jgi:hypothetical protein
MNAIPNRRFTIGRMILSFAFIFTAAANILSALVIIPKFSRLFQDALPGQVLPPLTRFILSNQDWLVIVASVLSILGLWAIFRRLPTWCAFCLLVSGAQVGMTLLALFLPIMQMQVGLNDR